MGSSISNLDFLDPPSNEGELGTLGHYRIIDQLGKGGMGFVFRAEDTRLQRSVALKVMNRKIAATPNSRARFISEARAMAAVHHDNVATIFEVGELNKTPYMAMEMLKGSTLEKFKGEATRPSYSQIIQFAKEMARGLAAAHSQGIVHRDIKPANMWIESDSDRIKILDFGLALASTPVDQLAGRGAVIGTPGYLSPEQARSEPLDDRSDLYSVGVVLYELATGELPLQNKSVAGQLIAILSKPPRPLRELNPDIPKPLADLIHKLLRKEPRHRISSAANLEKELDRVAVECESKSEVAQALNKLQAGLSEIVSQKDEPDLSAAMELPDLPDPFAALPDSLPDPVIPSASTTASPAPAPAAASPYQKKKRVEPVKKPDVELSTLKKYWPIIAAVAAIVLVLVPATIFMVSTGQKRGNVVISSTPDSIEQTNAAYEPENRPQNNAPRERQPPKSNSAQASNGNNGDDQDTAVKVAAREVSDAFAPGALVLIDSTKGNGSFEDLASNGQSIKGSGQMKKSIPGWSMVLRGQKAGVSAQDARGASDGRHYAFAHKKSSLDLTSDAVDYRTQPGDVFRVVFDAGSEPGEGKWLGKTKYSVVIGFRGSEIDASKWKLGEVQDQTNINQKKRTIGYEYAAQSDDIGKKPFVKIGMTETTARRSISYLDNVRLTVFSPSSMAANSQSTTDLAMETSPVVEMNPGGQPRGDFSGDPPPASAMASTDMANATNPSSADSLNSEPSPAPPLQTVIIRTSDEGGADATVKKGGSTRDTLGTKPFVAVQMRGGIPIQHSYLKFNLEKITPEKKGDRKNSKRKTGRVALMLRASGNQSPAGGEISVYGASNEDAQVWEESGVRAIHWKVSYSDAGLSQLPLLAVLTIPDDQEKESLIRITSPELADFIRNSPGRRTTLVLEGQSDSRFPLAFVSSEGDRENAPALIVEIVE